MRLKLNIEVISGGVFHCPVERICESVFKIIFFQIMKMNFLLKLMIIFDKGLVKIVTHDYCTRGRENKRDDPTGLDDTFTF